MPYDRNICQGTYYYLENNFFDILNDFFKKSINVKDALPKGENHEFILRNTFNEFSDKYPLLCMK